MGDSPELSCVPRVPHTDIEIIPLPTLSIADDDNCPTSHVSVTSLPQSKRVDRMSAYSHIGAALTLVSQSSDGTVGT